MIIINKPRSVWRLETVVGIIVTIVITIVYLQIFPNYLLGILCSFFIAFLVIRGQIASGRILKMNSENYTVSFLNFERTYNWDDLKVKRIEYRRNIKIYDLPYKIKYIVFSPHPIYKNRKGIWNADLYSILMHPFSVTYIYLIPQKKLEKIGSSLYGYLGYVMEEKLFIEKMKEWNVEIDYGDDK